jgi:hypothetical protein
MHAYFHLITEYYKIGGSGIQDPHAFTAQANGLRIPNGSMIPVVPVSDLAFSI